MRNLLSIISFLCLLPLLLLICTVFVVEKSATQGITVSQSFWFLEILPYLALSTLITYLINRVNIRLNHFDFMLSSFIFSGIGITWIRTSEVTPTIVILIGIIVFYFLLKILLQQKRYFVEILLVGLCLTGIVEAIWGLRQLYGFSPSQHPLFITTGSFYNPGPYGGYIASIAPIAFYLLLKYRSYFSSKIKKEYWAEYLQIGIAILTLTTILLVLPSTGSRASWLASSAGCLIAFLCHRRLVSQKMFANKPFVLVCFFVCVCVILFAMKSLYSLKRDSADGRILIWKNTVSMIADNPAGIGVGRYSGVYGYVQSDYFKNGKGSEKEKMIAGSPEYGFNEFLQIPAEFGIIPFVIFIVIIILANKYALIAGRWGPMGALTSLLTFASMSYPFSLIPFIITFVLLLVVCTGAKEVDRKAQNRISTSLLVSIIFMLSITGYIASRKKRLEVSYDKWAYFQNLYQAKAYQTAEKAYAKEYEHLNNNIEYLFQYGQILFHLENHNKSIDILSRATTMSCDPMLYSIIGKNYQAMGEYEKAVEYFNMAIYNVPHRLYPYYLLTQMYIQQDDVQSAASTAKKLLSLEVKVPSLATMQIRDDMQHLLDSLGQ